MVYNVDPNFNPYILATEVVYNAATTYSTRFGNAFCLPGYSGSDCSAQCPNTFNFSSRRLTEMIWAWLTRLSSSA